MLYNTEKLISQKIADYRKSVVGPVVVVPRKPDQNAIHGKD